MRWLLLCCILLWCDCLFGQTQISSRLESLGGSAIAINSLDNLFQNPANFNNPIEASKSHNFQILASYRPNLLHESLNETLFYSGMSSYNKFHVGIGGGGFNFYDVYKQSFLGVGISRNFGPGFKLGFAWNQFNFSIVDLENYTYHQFHLGTSAIWNSKLQTAFAVQLLNYDEISNSQNSHFKFTLGVLYQVHSFLKIISDVRYSNQDNAFLDKVKGVDFNVGFEYSLIPDVLFIRGGMLKSRKSQHLGLAYRFSNFTFHVSGTHLRNHPLVPQIDIHYGKDW